MHLGLFTEDYLMSGQKRSSIALGIVADRWGRILMIRRRNEEVGASGAKLLWAFPGGRIKKGERKSACAAREILVETGYAVRPIRLISVRRHPEFNVLVSYYFALLQKDKPVREPSEPHEVAEVVWFTAARVEEVVATNIDPAVRRLLRRIGRSARSRSLPRFIASISRTSRMAAG